jgi:hypothetical protein
MRRIPAHKSLAQSGDNLALRRPRLLVYLRPERVNQGCRQLIRHKPKRSRLALVGHAALRVDQIEPIWPAGVGSFGRVAELVEHGRKLNTKFSHACPRDECPFFFRLRAGKNNLVSEIALRLPHIAGMGFSYIHSQECYPPAILFIKLVEGRYLPPERWSSVAAEDQNHRLPLV